jgi:hypothetical protein
MPVLDPFRPELRRVKELIDELGTQTLLECMIELYDADEDYIKDLRTSLEHTLRAYLNRYSTFT